MAKRHTLAEAGALLGNSDRQLRYMIQQGELRATKSGKRWYIKAEDMPDNAKRDSRTEGQLHELQQAAEPTKKRKYSVKDLRAFQHSRVIYDALRQRLGPEHPTSLRMRNVLDQLSQGCHAFPPEHKAKHYEVARDQAASVVVDLILLGGEDELVQAQAEALEQVVLPTIGELLHGHS